MMMTVGRFLMTLSAGLFAAYVVFFGGALVLFALRDLFSPHASSASDHGGQPPAGARPVVGSASAEARPTIPALARTAHVARDYAAAQRPLKTWNAQGGASL
ncbi:MAG: hypothetical protein ACTH01_10460 [Micrococcaceae bacterium]